MQPAFAELPRHEFAIVFRGGVTRAASRLNQGVSRATTMYDNPRCSRKLNNCWSKKPASARTTRMACFPGNGARASLRNSAAPRAVPQFPLLSQPCSNVKPLDDQLIHGIMGVNNESPVRQGTPNKHYGKTLEEVKKDPSSFLDRCDYICAYGRAYVLDAA